MSLFDVGPPQTPQKEKASLSLSEVRRLGKRKLLELVEPAIDALQRAINSGDKDDYISVKAACAILDRTGFGVHSTITVDDKVDYSKLSNTQILARINMVKAQIEKGSPESREESGNKVKEFPKQVH